MTIQPASFTELAAASPKHRVVFLLIACLSLWLLGGCGGGWQPDRQDPTGPGVDGSGIYGPSTQDSRVNLGL